MATTKIEIVDMGKAQNEEFKRKICLPYFKDIYKDLSSRSDDKKKGINKISMLEYAALPGVLGERFFAIMDTDRDGYLNIKEFVSGIMKVYYSNFEFVFDLYDFDGDGLVSKEDIRTLLSYIPVNHMSSDASVKSEGKFTQEGGGHEIYQDRLDTLKEMYAMLDECFEEREQINFSEFEKIITDVSSDMLLCILNLFREKLPCSENFWRYKRNFEKQLGKDIKSGLKINTDNSEDPPTTGS